MNIVFSEIEVLNFIFDKIKNSGENVIHWPTTSSITISAGSCSLIFLVSIKVAHHPRKKN